VFSAFFNENSNSIGDWWSIRLPENWRDCVSSESSETMKVIVLLCRESESSPCTTCQGELREWLNEKRSMGGIWKAVEVIEHLFL